MFRSLKAWIRAFLNEGDVEDKFQVGWRANAHSNCVTFKYLITTRIIRPPILRLLFKSDHPGSPPFSLRADAVERIRTGLDQDLKAGVNLCLYFSHMWLEWFLKIVEEFSWGAKHPQKLLKFFKVSVLKSTHFEKKDQKIKIFS